MIKILILDQDILYCRRVCLQINFKAKQFKCYNQNDYDDAAPLLRNLPVKTHRDMCRDVIDLNITEIDWDSTLVIYNPSQYYNLPGKSNSMMLLENPFSDNSGTDEISICQISKYCSATAMIGKINTYLDEHPSLSPAVHEKNLICILGAACPLLRTREIDKIVREKLEKGFKVIRLDLCPPYFSDCPVTESTGYTLSDAFLRLMADDLAYEDFGVFLCQRSDGSLQFRSIERADDLFECSPDNFRKFTGLLNEWIINTNYQYFIIINCYAIPFSAVYTIAVQCDQLILINQDKISARTTSYNKELSYLLTNLPNTCDVREILLTCPEVN